MKAILVALSLVPLVGCGSSPEPKKTEAPQHAPTAEAWREVRFGIAECDTLIASMSKCLQQFEDGAGTATDEAMAKVVATWRETDDRDTVASGCRERLKVIAETMGGVCPEVTWQ